MDKEFYDLCYEAWRSGRNPDAVSIDRYDAKRADGYYPDEITLDMVLPRPAKEQPDALLCPECLHYVEPQQIA